MAELLTRPESEGPREGIATVGEGEHAVRLAYAVHGADRAGLPAILVMGFTMPGRAWRFIVPELAGERPVLTFDNRGSGQSDVPHGPYSMRQLAADTFGLADRLGWSRFHLVGVSMGGMIVQEAALAHPDRLASLTLIATHPGGVTGRLPRGQGLWHFARANLTKARETRYRSLSHLLFPKPFRLEKGEPLLAELLAHDFEPPAPRAGRKAQLKAVFGHDTRKRLHALAGLPTLIIKPELDLLVHPKNSELLHALIPGSRILRFPDAGHGLIRQKGPELGHALREHFALAEVGATAPASPPPLRSHAP